MIALALLLAVAPVGSADKISTLVVYGNDPCPKGAADEIVVCARQPEGERYRVPKRFREKKPVASDLSWAGTAEQLEWIGRTGTPNTCSTVGSGGQTGCFQKFLRDARAQKEYDRQQAAEVP